MASHGGNHGEATIMNPNICAKLKHDQFEHNPKHTNKQRVSKLDSNPFLEFSIYNS
jgi:hypothetical protein